MDSQLAVTHLTDTEAFFHAIYASIVHIFLSCDAFFLSGTPLAMRCDIVVLVYPSIGRKFCALLNGQGFVSSPRVNTHRVIVSNAWP